MSFEKLKQRWARDREIRRLDAEMKKKRLHASGEQVFKKFGVKKVVLFGSGAYNRCNHLSDIDIFVHPLTNECFWDFRRELEERVGYPIDLYTTSDDPKLVGKILSRGEIIYEV